MGRGSGRAFGAEDPARRRPALAAVRVLGRRVVPVEEGDQGSCRLQRRESEVTLTVGPHCHVAYASAKPPCKTAGWPNVNGFNS